MGCIMFTKVDNPSNNAENGAELNIAAAGKANNFAADTVFLIGEREGGKGGRAYSGKVCRKMVNAISSNKELDIAEAKRRRLGLGAGVFARTEKEKEGKGNHVGNCKIVDRICNQGGSHDMPNNIHRDRFYPVRRWILLAVEGELAFKPEINFSLGRNTGVWGPHTRKRLPNTP